MNDYEDKLTWRDVLAYLLVYSLWIAISAAALYALMLLRSAFPAPLLVLLARNPYFHTHTVELNGLMNSVDRLLLIVFAIAWIIFILWVEEYFRASIVKSRERRASTHLRRRRADQRNRLAALEPGPVPAPPRDHRSLPGRRVCPLWDH